MALEDVARAAQIVRDARHVVAITGAGISTPSGIPDFRSEEGLWARQDPFLAASLSGFLRDPSLFYRWFAPLLAQILRARANPAHLALAALERSGKLRALITQNIDGLHQQAGSNEVYELHGHLRSATCVGCGRQVPAKVLERRASRGDVPRCACGSAYKPDVVLFGEELPRVLYWLGLEALQHCDTVLVVGSALEVFPVSGMALPALNRGARLVVVNRTPTHLDARADVVLREDIAVALPAIVG